VDGSGRDTYIHANNGGFTVYGKGNAMDPRITFSKNLRTYEQDGDYLLRRNYPVTGGQRYRRNDSPVGG
jgi:hypothetical protein